MAKDSRFGYYDGALNILEIQMGDKKAKARVAIPPEDLDLLASMYLDASGIQPAFPKQISSQVRSTPFRYMMTAAPGFVNYFHIYVSETKSKMARPDSRRNRRPRLISSDAAISLTNIASKRFGIYVLNSAIYNHELHKEGLQKAFDNERERSKKPRKKLEDYANLWQRYMRK